MNAMCYDFNVRSTEDGLIPNSSLAINHVKTTHSSLRVPTFNGWVWSQRVLQGHRSLTHRRRAIVVHDQICFGLQLGVLLRALYRSDTRLSFAAHTHQPIHVLRELETVTEKSETFNH